MSKRSLTVAQKRLIIARSGGLCEYCKCPEALQLNRRGVVNIRRLLILEGNQAPD